MWGWWQTGIRKSKGVRKVGGERREVRRTGRSYFLKKNLAVNLRNV